MESKTWQTIVGIMTAITMEGVNQEGMVQETTRRILVDMFGKIDEDNRAEAFVMYRDSLVANDIPHCTSWMH